MKTNRPPKRWINQRALTLALSMATFVTNAQTCAIPTKTNLFTQEPLFQRGTKKRQTAYYISPKAANQLVTNRAAFLIDVRDKKAFQNFNIPGSLNIPPHLLKTKTFLKSKHLILVNEGHSYKKLEKMASTLTDFKKVSILDGGLIQWSKQIGSGNQRHLNKITPAQFFVERDYEHWLIVNVSDNPQPQTLNLPITPHFVTKLKQQTKSSPYILITSAQGDNYPKIEALLRHTDLMNTFYLIGGTQAYQQFRQTAMSVARNQLACNQRRCQP